MLLWDNGSQVAKLAESDTDGQAQTPKTKYLEDGA